MNKADRNTFRQHMTNAGLAVGERVDMPTWEQRVMVYYDELGRFTDEVIKKAFDSLVRKEGARYFPSLGDMLAKCNSFNAATEKKAVKDLDDEEIPEKVWRAAYHVKYSPRDMASSLKKVLLENWELAQQWFTENETGEVIERLNARINMEGY